jgi:two-component system, NtrC family, response regulator AtoC
LYHVFNLQIIRIMDFLLILFCINMIHLFAVLYNQHEIILSLNIPSCVPGIEVRCVSKNSKNNNAGGLKMGSFRIFVVEDDPWYAEMLKYHLSLNPDFEVEKFETGSECLGNMHKKPSLVTVDFSLPDMNGKELLMKIHKYSPGTAVIIISGQEDITTAVELLKVGAFDYIVKNEDTRNRLWNSIRMYRENLSLREENERLLEEVGKKYDFSKVIVGTSSGIREIFSRMEKAAGSQITVSVTGETGTGKELVAKAIHYHSSRKKHPFVAVNIGAIPKDLIESELFGYEKGAFTGAISRKSGLFEDADKGTIFLDEIAEMDLNMQTKFLRVLQEREIKRIGGSQVIKIDIRVITATHKNLAEEVKKGTFRADLFYRLMGLPIHLPPLRERGNDILVLARHFADEFSKVSKMKKVVFTEEAIKKLTSYPYPGNVRELRAVIELAIILSDDNRIEAHHISFNAIEPDFDEGTDDMTLNQHLLRIVRNYLRKYNHNPTVVSRKLGISRATVYRYIKELET